MLVEEVMTKNPIVAKPTTTVGEVMEQMTTAGVRHIPVVDHGDLVGVINDRDIRMLSAAFLKDDSSRSALRAPVSHLMSGDVLAVSPLSELKELIDLLIEERVGAVPVVDEVSGDVVGIVSYVDVLRVLKDAA